MQNTLLTKADLAYDKASAAVDMYWTQTTSQSKTANTGANAEALMYISLRFKSPADDYSKEL